ncbi:MAG: TAXI family TRAP transporter solute-binding subunit [Devosiaceae bacterium]|nr:TAXI family TRAP transporter solute-binding subunit [Devosiaceae bacterium]
MTNNILFNKVLRKFTFVKSIILIFLFASNPSYSFEVNIMTGGATGTYIQIGNDIANLAKAIDMDVTVVESAGSMENIEAVRDRPFTQFGIVQSDVLDFIKTFKNEDKAMRRIANGTKIAFPLYNEEVHIVAKSSSSINVIADLSGKIVAVGAPNSGTNLTSTFLFEVTNIRPQTLVTIKASQALEELRAGRIDAFVYVAGAPTKLLLDTNANDDLKLIPVAAGAISGYYGTATIKAGTYPWLRSDVLTPAVKAVLMTYQYDPNRNDYLKQSCEVVTKISYLINRNIEYLRQNGHPKWKQVDLNALPPGWERGNCVKTALEEGYQLPTINVINSISPAPTQAPAIVVNCDAIQNPVAKRLCLMKSEG